MNAIKTLYDDLPETIQIPPDFVHKKAEIIIFIDEEPEQSNKRLIDFFGICPDFPERFPQGNFETRESL